MRFGLVGLCGVGVNVAILRVAHGELQVALPIASAIAVEFAIVTNFLLNNWWTFGERSVSLQRFGRYNLAALGGLAITTAILLRPLTFRPGMS